jgi:hypothetical protein
MKKDFDRTKSNADPEADLIWDEYKYRHDLIWKHMIRSTIAVIGLVTFPFTKEYTLGQFEHSFKFLEFISGALIIFIIFNTWVINREISLLNEIKLVHRIKQNLKFDIHKRYVEKFKKSSESNANKKKLLYWLRKLANFDFRFRVNLFNIILLIVALVSFMNLIDQNENDKHTTSTPIIQSCPPASLKIFLH